MSNFYVRPTQQGTHSGADWNNAWSPSGIVWASVHGGDTVWVAGGTYTGANASIEVGASGTSASVRVKILKARTSDSVPVAAAGWQASFGGQAVMQFGGIGVPQGSFITIDGQDPSGFLLVMATTGGWMCSGGYTGDVNDIYLSHFEIAGTSNESGLTSERYAFQWVYNNINNVTFDHMIIHDVCNAWRSYLWHSVTIQYCQVWNMTTDPLDHCDLIYVGWDSSNIIFRYNTCYNSEADGFMFESGSSSSDKRVHTNWLLYGNVFYNFVFSIVTVKQDCVVQFGLYNNVFGGVDAGASYSYLTLQGTLANNTFIENNIFYNCVNGFTGAAGTISDYNGYYPRLTNGWPQPVAGETHSQLLANLPFVNPGGGDFHISASGNSLVGFGTPLTNDGFLNKDMDGNTRSTWDVGAFEYGGGGVTPPPGITVRAGSQVSPAGYRGPAGAPGPSGPPGGAGVAGPVGPGAYSNTTSSFTVPSIGSTVTVPLFSASWATVGEFVYVAGANGSGQAGLLQVQSISGNSLVLLNPPAPIGGVPEAPTDGLLYGRKSAAWSLVSGGGGGGIPEAPTDGSIYGRQTSAWTVIAAATGGGSLNTPFVIQRASSGNPGAGNQFGSRQLTFTTQNVAAGSVIALQISFGQGAVKPITGTVTSVNDTLNTVYAPASTFTACNATSESLGEIIYVGKTTAAGPCTVTVITSASMMFFSIGGVEVGNCSGVVDIASSASADAPTLGNTATAPAITTTADKDLVLGFFSMFDGPNSTQSGWTTELTDYTMYINSHVASPQGSNTATAASAGVGGWVATAVALKASSTGGGGAAAIGDMLKSVYDVNNDGVADLASTAVAPGSYTNTNLTVDQKGRITAASNGTGGGGGAPSGAAGGDLAGTYPNPTLGTTAVTAGSYTNTNLTVDAKGRVTAASNGSAGGGAPTGAAGGDLTGTYPNPTLATTAVGAGSYTNAGFTVDAKGRLTAASSGTGVGLPYDMAMFVAGKPGVSQLCMRFVFIRPVSMPANFTASVAKAAVAATASTTFNIAKNGSNIGTLVFAAAGTTGTFTVSGGATFVSGDLLTVTAPASADSTLADISATLTGTRT